MQAFISRVKSIEQAFAYHENVAHFIGERSWFADSFVFEPLLHRDGHISDIEHAGALSHKSDTSSVHISRAIEYAGPRPFQG